MTALQTVRQGTVAVLLGGASAEREVSLQSGATVAQGLREAGFNVCEIDPQQAGWVQRLDGVDFVFNVLHGPGGEDGTVQGLLTSCGIPYSGSGVLGSALSMDKLRTKQLWQGIGIPTADFAVLTQDTDFDEVMARYGKVFVKPACEGSSIGMGAAESAQALREAYAIASEYAGQVIAERFLAGAEYTVGVLGGETLPSIRLETDNEFYDYEAKYLSDDTRYLLPSGLSEQEEAELAVLSLRAFSALDCAVWGRVDVMRDASGRFHVLEVNTVPGMTSHSLVPMGAAAIGMSISALVERIVALSLEVRR